MSEFAIVSEGVTDYAVLKNILIGWFKDQEVEPFLKPYQPDPTADGESNWQQFGNWENVFRYLREKKYQDALSFAEYLIVQIDTDVSEHPNFDVSQQENGQLLEPAVMVERVEGKLGEIIGPDDLAYYGDRIIFAICVREIECWLLPLWDSSKAHKCTSCTSAMDQALARKGESPLNKNRDRYEEASKEYRKRKVLLSEGTKNPSLAIFLNELERREIILTED